LGKSDAYKGVITLFMAQSFGLIINSTYRFAKKFPPISCIARNGDVGSIKGIKSRRPFMVLSGMK